LGEWNDQDRLAAALRTKIALGTFREALKGLGLTGAVSGAMALK
jgi:hypothetical protein